MPLTRKRTVLAVVAVVALAALSLLVAVVARADDGGHDGDHNRADENGTRLFTAALAPSLTTDPAIHGVSPGGAPWVLDRGRVILRSDGRIRVDVRGLVIPVPHGTFPANTARPVTTVTASLYCAPDASGAVATTAAAPISESGDARIDDTLTLPQTCLAPTVLVHPNGIAGAYIALPGWRS